MARAGAALVLVPLYGFAEGDAMGLLVLAHDDWTIAQVAARLRESAALRAHLPSPGHVFAGGRLLAPELTVAGAGLRALDRIDLRREERA